MDARQRTVRRRDPGDVLRQRPRRARAPVVAAALSALLQAAGCGAARPDFQSVVVRIPVIGRVSLPATLAGSAGAASGCAAQGCTGGFRLPLAVIWALTGVGALVVVAGICAVMVILERRRGSERTD